MKVYLVESICDEEYGCRAVEAVCATWWGAKAYIDKHGGNTDVEFWTGQVFPYYVISKWEVSDDE